MFKRVGAFALLLCGVALVHPTAAGAQEYGGWYGGRPQYRAEGRYGRDRNQFREERRERDWRAHEWRDEERAERRWREQNWREHERWERQGYRTPNGYPPSAYYGYGY